MQTKLCGKCKKEYPISEFPLCRDNRDNKQYHRSYCRTCSAKCNRYYCYSKNINKSMDKNKTCTLYLGVYIAERILSNYFENITKMSPGNKGYDFICKNGYKIDVKSSCINEKIISNKSYYSWYFIIKRNKSADYFLCLAFDNRNDLNPLHIWLIPGDVVNDKICLTISNSKLSMNKWSKYEKSIDEVVNKCNVFKEFSHK